MAGEREAGEAEAAGSSEAMEAVVSEATAFGVAISIVTWPRPVTVPLIVESDSVSPVVTGWR